VDKERLLLDGMREAREALASAELKIFLSTVTLEE
jgi:hypothetical protein